MKSNFCWRSAFLIGVLAIVTVIIARRHFRATSSTEGISVEGGQAMEVQIPIQPHKQWDERWCHQPLGPTTAKIGSTGCTLCAVSMALSSQGFLIDPLELNRQLRERSGFTESGLLVWSAVSAITQRRFLVEVLNRPDHVVIDRQLAAGNPVIAKVLYKDSIWHWVLITGKHGFKYLIHDPLSTEPKSETMVAYPRGIFALRWVEKG